MGKWIFSGLTGAGWLKKPKESIENAYAAKMANSKNGYVKSRVVNQDIRMDELVAKARLEAARAHCCRSSSSWEKPKLPDPGKQGARKNLTLSLGIMHYFWWWLVTYQECKIYERKRRHTPAH